MNRMNRMHFMLFQTLMVFTKLFCECRKLDGYAFPVYTTNFCPGNEKDWNKRSSSLSCNESNGYTCLPNENFTQLLEFCYRDRWILIEEGFCLYLIKNNSLVHSHNCSQFQNGCPHSSYLSSKIFEYPSCIHIENGCFIADPVCKSATSNPPKDTKHTEIDNKIGTSLGILMFFICICTMIVLILYIKRRKVLICRSEGGAEVQDIEEFDSFVRTTEPEKVDPCNEFPTSKRNNVKRHEKLSQSYENQQNEMEYSIDEVEILKTQIGNFKKTAKDRYCALMLLCFFKDDLCFENIPGDDFSIKRFKRALKLCEMNTNTEHRTIEVSLDLLNGILVRKIEQTYKFFDDNVKAIANYVIGTDCPKDMIKYAEIGFLRKRVKIDTCCERKDALTIYLKESHIERLGERLFNDIFGSHIIDVVINPCLKNEKVIETFKRSIKDQPEKDMQTLLTRFINISGTKQLPQSSLCSKLHFLTQEGKISPLFALIAFCHTDLSLFCLKYLQHTEIDLKHSFLFSAVCFSGSMEIFKMLSKALVRVSLKEKWGFLYPIHTVSLFHNYEILGELVQIGVDVNLKTDDEKNAWTPLTLAARLNSEEERDSFQSESSNLRRDKTVHLLLDSNADIKLPNSFKESILHLACENGLSSIVKLLLDKDADINSRSKDGKSPLHKACEKGHKTTVELLLNKGAQANLFCKREKSPLHEACKNAHLSIVDILLENNADINILSRQEGSPLHQACKYGHDSTVHHLLDKGANIDLRSEDKKSPLYEACEKGHESTVKCLLSKGADINLCDEQEVSPLSVACENGHKSIVDLLLANGAKINCCCEEGTSPLYNACKNGHKSIVQILLRKGAKVDLVSEYLGSPLHVACAQGHESIVKILLKWQADINLLNSIGGKSPLYVACENEHEPIMDVLLRNGADINLADKCGESPFYEACRKGCISTIKLLLNNRAKINLCRDDDESPLHEVCKKGHNAAVEILLKQGAIINSANTFGETALHKACRKGHASTVKVLLQNGAEINSLTKSSATPLYEACKIGHTNIAQLLLSKGADIRLCNNYGESPLHVASSKGHDCTVEMLLNNDAHIDLVSKQLETPLHEACKNGNDSTVRLLIKKGADISMCNSNNESPLDVAAYNENDSTVRILKTYVAVCLYEETFENFV